MSQPHQWCETPYQSQKYNFRPLCLSLDKKLRLNTLQNPKKRDISQSVRLADYLRNFPLAMKHHHLVRKTTGAEWFAQPMNRDRFWIDLQNRLLDIDIFWSYMANRIDTDRDRPYVLTDQASGRQVEGRIVEKWSIGPYRMMSFRCSAAKRPVRPTTTLTIARPENALKTMGRVKVVRVLQYRGRSVLLDCRVLKTK